MDAYLYILSSEEDEAINCGIKLSDKGEKDVPINGYPVMCISALLNPKDDMEKYNSGNYSCIRIDIDPSLCYIADKALYGKESMQEFYIKSIIPSKEYVFGTYMYPECLIPRTILPESLSKVHNAIGSPILYETSEGLYRKNLIENLRDSIDYFDDLILELYFDKLMEEGMLISSSNSEMKIYFDDKYNYFTVKKVDIPNILKKEKDKIDEIYKHTRR